MAYHTGLFLTSIVVTPADAAAGSKVTFKESDKNGTNGVFLKDVVQTNDVCIDGKREFEATVVSLEEATEIAATGWGENTCTPLFIVHGFNVEPGVSLKCEYGNFNTGDKSYFPIPVIWASEGKTWRYFKDQKRDVGAVGAGKALEALVNIIPNNAFPRKSLLMHSMGNHAIFNGACADKAPDVQFENIFMVAADVPYDIFHKKPNNCYISCRNRKTFGNKKTKANNFFQMLSRNANGDPKGKIYILWNEGDLALLASGLLNCETRIGKVGSGWVGFCGSYDGRAIRDEFKPFVENFDVSNKKMEDVFQHSCCFESWAVEYYEEKSKLVVGE